MSLQNKAYQLFNSELEHWKLAAEKYAELHKSIAKSFSFGDFSVEVVCNLARLRSTMAEVKQRVEQMRITNTNNVFLPQNNEEKCFLCSEIRPQEQQAIEINDFQILINPYPIFPKHFTIAHKKHTPQLIIPYFTDFMYFAKHLPDFAVFYNGANCGASAPYHAHFQAAEKQYFNVIKDFHNFSDENFEIIDRNSNFTLKLFKNYLRKTFCIETPYEKTAKEVFMKYFYNYIETSMLNVICVFENGKYLIFIFPRKKFRPTQFYEEDEHKRISISPGSVELSGRFVTVFKEHFDRITQTDIVDIFRQIS